MSNRVVECVPNISEGRDPRKIEQIVAAARDVEGVDVLDVDPGRETNRTVITMVGAPEPVIEAAFRLIARAAELIDMSKHEGAHARHGATDVCPFVPVSGVTMPDCVEFAKTLGKRVGEELRIPVYLYDQAAQMPSRRSLAKVRAGEYEALPEKMKKPEWKPDFGPAEFNAKSGVVTIGAREFLIAYNINLNSNRKEHADDIAHELREKGRAVRIDQTTPYYDSGKLKKYAPSKGEYPCAYTDFVAKSLDELAGHYEAQGRDLMAELAFFGRDPEKLEGVNVMKKGLFEECRGVGWVIPEYNRAQLSFNLTNFKVTAVHDVYEQARELARDRGLVVTGSEIVGLIPYPAIRETGEFYLACQGASRGAPLPDVMECAVQALGLRDVADFEIEKSVLGIPQRAGSLASMKVVDLADEVSRATPAPGGGSIAALAGSLGASLASMVGNLTYYKKSLADRQDEMEELAMRAQALKDELLHLVDADTDAFGDVLTAMRMPRATPEEKTARDAAIMAGYKVATDIPFRTAELCLDVLALCRKAAEQGLPTAVSDAGVGALMARSGLIGAVYNVRINLGSIKDAAWVADRSKSLEAMVARGEALERETRDIVEASF